MTPLNQDMVREDTAHWTGRALYALLRWCGLDQVHPYRRQLAAYRLASLHALITSPLPVPLSRLFARYGSDKHQSGGHSYGFTYAEYLRRFRYRRIRFLEIGIGGYSHTFGGRSLLAWKAFFPFARIVACDLVAKPQLAGARVQIRQTDQSSADDLARLAKEDGPFDVIIDDGSHFSAHQIFSFERLFDSLNDGGIYFIEDVQTSYWPEEVGGVQWDGRHVSDDKFSETCVGYFTEISKYLNHAEFLPSAQADQNKVTLSTKIQKITFEHNLIIVFRGTNNNLSNSVQKSSVSR